MILFRLGIDALRVALLLAAALVALRLLRGRSAAARTWLLTSALAGALVLPLVSAVTPAWTVEAPRAVELVVGRPVAERAVDGGGAALTVAPRTEAASPAPERARRPWDPIMFALFAWALGAAVTLARVGLGYRRASAIARRARAVDRGWLPIVTEAELAIGARARVVVSGEIDAPAVTGIARPVILLPRSSDGWSRARRRAVLLHELAHVGRRDGLAQLVAQLACVVYWFNPLAWIAARALREERELAADDLVVGRMRPSTYAEHLLALAGAFGAARSVPDAALGMTEGDRLARRVSAIVDPSRRRGPLTPALAVGIALAALGVVFAVSCAQPVASEQTPPRAATTGAAPATSLAEGSTIDRRLQAIADEELDRVVTEVKPDTASILVLDPKTGEILANAGRVGGAAADVAITRVYQPASTFKAILIAAALDEGAITPTQELDCGDGTRAYGSKVLKDGEAHKLLSLREAFAVSSNVGASRVFDALGGARLGKWIHKFHFGEAPDVGGVAAASGAVPASFDAATFDGALVSIGHGITASPLQMAAAYASFANDGVYHPPTLRRGRGGAGERVLRPETARAMIALMEGAVNDPSATGKKAQAFGVRVAGKTGTGEFTAAPDGATHTYGTFVGVVPADRPRFVIVVGVDSTRDGYTGGTTAAPVFSRVASRALSP